MLILLCDFTLMLKKYQHVYKHLKNGNLKTGVVFGFSRFYQQVKEIDNFNIIFAMDTGTSDRKLYLPDYKANRFQCRPPNNKDIVSLFSDFPDVRFIHSYKKEADDVISSFSHLYQNDPRVKSIRIYSTDSDFYQLMYLDKVVISTSIKDKQFVDSPLGSIPPDMYPYYKSLIGDTSDNIHPVYPRIRKDFSLELACLAKNTGNLLTAASILKDKYPEQISKVLDSLHLWECNLRAIDLTYPKEEIFTYTTLRAESTTSKIIDKYDLKQFKESYARYRAVSSCK